MRDAHAEYSQPETDTRRIRGRNRKHPAVSGLGAHSQERVAPNSIQAERVSQADSSSARGPSPRAGAGREGTREGEREGGQGNGVPRRDRAGVTVTPTSAVSGGRLAPLAAWASVVGSRGRPHALLFQKPGWRSSPDLSPCCQTPAGSDHGAALKGAPGKWRTSLWEKPAAWPGLTWRGGGGRRRKATVIS